MPCATASVAASCVAASARRSARIGILAENRVEFIACYFGIMRMGAVSLPIAGSRHYPVYFEQRLLPLVAPVNAHRERERCGIDALRRRHRKVRDLRTGQFRRSARPATPTSAAASGGAPAGRAGRTPCAGPALGEYPGSCPLRRDVRPDRRARLHRVPPRCRRLPAPPALHRGHVRRRRRAPRRRIIV